MKNIAFSASSEWYLYNFKSEHAEYLSHNFLVTAFVPTKKEGFLNAGRIFKKINRYPVDPYGTNPAKEMTSIFCYGLTLLKSRPDIVLSFNPKSNLHASAACWLLRIPIILNVSGAGSASNLKGVKGWIYNSVTSFFYKRAKHIFFQNQQDFSIQVDKFSLETKKCSLLPGSGVNFEKYEPARDALNEAHFYPHDNKPFIFLMVARLIVDKGIGEYLAAAKKFKEENKNAHVEFWLVGQEDSSNRSFNIHEASIKEKEAVKYLGVVSDMPHIYSQVHSMVLPSYYPEGTPRSLIEAAASGKPLITTRMPGCQDVVDEGVNGYKVDPKKVDQLKNAMQKLYELSEVDYLDFCQASIEKAKKEFSEEIVFNAYDSEISKVID